MLLILESHRSSHGGGRTSCTPPLDPPGVVFSYLSIDLRNKGLYDIYHEGVAEKREGGTL